MKTLNENIIWKPCRVAALTKKKREKGGGGGFVEPLLNLLVIFLFWMSFFLFWGGVGGGGSFEFEGWIFLGWGGDGIVYLYCIYLYLHTQSALQYFSPPSPLSPSPFLLLTHPPPLSSSHTLSSSHSSHIPSLPPLPPTTHHSLYSIS